MPDELLAGRLRSWRGRLRMKEAAALLSLPYGTFRKYEEGRRTPNKWDRAELEKRLADPGIIQRKEKLLHENTDRSQTERPEPANRNCSHG